ncbi:MAG: winged helix-turn-helix domain-containing protein [Paracoccaceae bacterium]
MTPPDDPPRLRIRIVFGEDEMMGPGRADLLEGIARTGSIAAAGREMRMSYKRAWSLIEAMNAMFREPVVQGTRGGPGVGGAVLTETGERVLALYRGLEEAAAVAGAGAVDELRALLREDAGSGPLTGAPEADDMSVQTYPPESTP